jgi:hypothetical protein
LHPSSPPFWARGPLPGLQAAEALCAAVAAAARGPEIELQVWLVRGAGAGQAAAKAPSDAPWAGARLRSGGEVMLGERSAQSYLHNYSVEVATDAGVAAPLVARAMTGDVLHARAMRVRDGSAVFVEGLLDLSRLSSLEDFELSSTDLGSVQQPRVRCVQIAFSGTVESGAPLRVAWAGLGGGEDLAEGSLWIVPRAQADGAAGRWRLLDNALLEAVAWELPAVTPGGGLGCLRRHRRESEFNLGRGRSIHQRQFPAVLEIGKTSRRRRPDPVIPRREAFEPEAPVCLAQGRGEHRSRGRGFDAGGHDQLELHAGAGLALGGEQSAG